MDAGLGHFLLMDESGAAAVLAEDVDDCLLLCEMSLWFLTARMLTANEVVTNVDV